MSPLLKMVGGKAGMSTDIVQIVALSNVACQAILQFGESDPQRLISTKFQI